MKVYNGFILFIATLLFIALGVGLILFAAMEEQTTRLLSAPDSFLRINSGLISLVGAGFILLAIGEIVFWLNSLNRMPVVAFNNPLGEVRVAYDALEEYIRNLSSEIYEIKDAKPQIIANREGIEIHARLIVERDVNLPELTARFQDLVSRYIKDVMGIENITEIKVYIQRIASRKASQERESSDEETV